MRQIQLRSCIRCSTTWPAAQCHAGFRPCPGVASFRVSETEPGCIRATPYQAVVSFTWDSNGRTLSYPYEEHMAECGDLSSRLADLIRRLLLIKLVWLPPSLQA